MIGQTIPHCTITAEFSEGGIDALYGQEDANLDRTVAVCFLSAQGARDIDRSELYELETMTGAFPESPNFCGFRVFG